ncbi:MAG: S41 family peptidase [Gemmatimonadales bacterium]|nr:MAG: S41 family peptidase [Gemmatimonadales bacterium]
MFLPKRAVLPLILVGGSILLGGWFLQEGVSRQENVFVQVRLFQEVMDHVSQQFVEEVDPAVLYDSAIDGVLEELDDPNTSFIEAQDWEDFRIRATEGNYGGVGLEVVPRDDFVTVMSAVPGGPGARAGIRPGDRFVEIAGQPAEGMSVDRAVEILRGEAGTSVDVKMGRNGLDDPISFSLTREIIRLKSVPFAVVLDGAGYVPLQVFRTTSSDEVRAEIERLADEGARGIVLDLRGNPGGLLEEGIDIAELFLPAGEKVVETRGRALGQSEVYRDGTPEVFPEIPLVVMVDETSASASEIVAGALQDHDRALVVGAPSFGKGSVQTLFTLSGGNVLRLTTAHWYTPVGRSIQKDVPQDRSDLPHGAWTLDNDLVATEDLPDRPEFQSTGGRTLLGGGGITPDLWVIQDTLATSESRAVQALYAQQGVFTRTLFNFVVDYLQANPRLAPDFSVDDALVAAFVRELRSSDFQASAQVLREADRYVRYQLESEIALQAFGEEGQFLRLQDRDRQLQEALRALGQSATPEELVALADERPGANPVGG